MSQNSPPPHSSEGDDFYRLGNVPSYPGQSVPSRQPQSGQPPVQGEQQRILGFDGPGSGGTYPHDHPKGTTIFVLGILSVLLCAPLGIFAWVMGNNAETEGRAGGVQYSNAGLIKAGKILGIIGTVLILLWPLYLFSAFTSDPGSGSF